MRGKEENPPVHYRKRERLSSVGSTSNVSDTQKGRGGRRKGKNTPGFLEKERKVTPRSTGVKR